jgi:hypothetical protein
MRTLLLFGPLLLAACGGVEAANSFAASSPASTAAPTGYRVPVATVLDAAEPGNAARSPLLAADAAAPPTDHSHHHHGPPAASTGVPAMDHSQHQGAPPASTGVPAVPAPSSTGPAMDHSHHHHQHGAGGSKP